MAVPLVAEALVVYHHPPVTSKTADLREEQLLKAYFAISFTEVGMVMLANAEQPAKIAPMAVNVLDNVTDCRDVQLAKAFN